MVDWESRVERVLTLRTRMSRRSERFWTSCSWPGAGIARRPSGACRWRRLERRFLLLGKVGKGIFVSKQEHLLSAQDDGGDHGKGGTGEKAMPQLATSLSLWGRGP